MKGAKVWRKGLVLGRQWDPRARRVGLGFLAQVGSDPGDSRVILSRPPGLGLPPVGVDDVFVFINTYRQATHLEDPQLRMIHTIQTAGKATFFTSLTTAAAYAANVFSQVGARPLPWLRLPPRPHTPGRCSSHPPLL